MAEKIGSFTAKITVYGTKSEAQPFSEPSNKNLAEAIAGEVKYEYESDNGVELKDLDVKVTIEDTMDDQ